MAHTNTPTSDTNKTQAKLRAEKAKTPPETSAKKFAFKELRRSASYDNASHPVYALKKVPSNLNFDDNDDAKK